MTKIKHIIFVAAILSVFCAWDFFNRLTIAGETADINRQIVNKKTGFIKFLSPDSKSYLENLLAQYDVVEEVIEPPKAKATTAKKPQVVLMSAEDQMRQMGNINDLFDGEDKFTLTATFNDSERKFALLTKKNLLTGYSAVIRVYQGEMLNNYNLNQVANNFVEFIQGSRKIQLQLFLIKNNKV